jgi:hypothetical protein
VLTQSVNSPGPVENLEKRLNLTDIGVIISLVISALTCAFTFGVMWRDVQENNRFRLESEKEKVELYKDISSIKTSVQYLVDRDKEQREINRQRGGL